MDFVTDALGNGRRFRALTPLDDSTREWPVIEVDFSVPGERVVRVLDELARTRELPRAICCDNGPEFAGRVLDQWADAHDVVLDFIDRECRCRTPTRRASMAGSGTSAKRELVRELGRCAGDD